MVGTTIEKIQVVLQAVTKGFSAGFDRVNNKIKSVGKNMQSFGTVMQMPLENFKMLNHRFKVMKDSGGRFARTLRVISHGMRGFRMEALGVMFFGMMMQRMFLGLLSPVMEAFGVFDIFRLMLLVLFLPVMEMIFPFLLKVMEWFMNLPEPVKKAIGIFVVIGLVLSTLAMVLGQLALGFGSLIQFFPKLWGAVKLVGSVFAWLGATAVAIIAAIIAVIIGIYVAWKENFMGMKHVVSVFIENVKGFFQNLATIVMAPFKVILAILRGDWKGAFEHMANVVIAFKNIIINIFHIIVSSCTIIFIGIVRVVKWIIDKVVGFFKWLYKVIVGSSIIPDLIMAIISWFWKLPKAVFDMFKKIVSGMFNIGKEIISNLVSGIKAMGRAVINAILSLFPSWMRRGIEAAGRITIEIVEKVKSVASRINPFNDFIWRPGQAPISINPNDTLVGYKGAPPNLGGGGVNTGNVTNNFFGFTRDDLKRELDDRDRRVVEDIRRLVKE